jgi:hypothetical protein
MVSAATPLHSIWNATVTFWRQLNLSLLAAFLFYMK